MNIKILGFSFSSLLFNFVYHHKNFFKHKLNMGSLPEKPQPEDYFKVPENYFDELDGKIQKIQENVDKTKIVQIDNNLALNDNFHPKNGKLIGEGDGILKSSNNEYTIIGSWQNQELNGPGLIEFKNKYRIIANFVNGKKEGFGYLNMADNFVYEGNFKNDRPFGKGKVLYRQGTVCIIDTYNENSEAYATCYPDLKMNEVIYKGEYKDFKIQGKGEMFLKDGSRYVGDVKDGLIEGQGKFFDRYGDLSYEGKFHNNQPKNIFNKELMINIGIATFTTISLLKK